MLCLAEAKLRVCILIAYVFMALASFGVLCYQFIIDEESSVYFGNLVSPPWSWPLNVLQHVFVPFTWAGYLVPEALVMVASHHIATYYRSLNTFLGEHFQKWVQARRSSLLAYRSDMTTKNSFATQNNTGIYSHTDHETPPFPNSLSIASVSTVTSACDCHQQAQDSQREYLNKLRETWSLYEDVGDFLGKFNALFSPIILINLASFLIMTCTLLIPVLKIHLNDDPRNNK
ncbi:uncharacterized protein LOC121862953 [Homarus americanus]|uniref:uncharacterized protein LOC121862953 n=1 Tax=Homarus americanus TaxID=6706 RepID=UPI001C494344|nr:uncharacterized protein LOC121862953 [Homarus americanus]